MPPTQQLSTSAPVVAQLAMVSAPRSRVPTDNPTTRVYAHATGEWRQAPAWLDELAALLPATDRGPEQRAT